jgi:hypothetical protein
VVGKEWGGTGTLHAQGNLSTGADLSAAGRLTAARAHVNGLALGTGGGGLTYQFEYESIGVTTPGMNLRLQSPGDIYFHTGGNPPVQRMWLDSGGTVTVAGGARVGADLRVGGALSWSGDQTGARPGFIRLGAMLLCWDFIDINVTQGGYHPTPVTFPRRFAEDPVVTISLSDTGYNRTTDEAGVGAYALHPGGFTAAYKANVPVSNIRIFWMAIGRAA